MLRVYETHFETLNSGHLSCKKNMSSWEHKGEM